MNKQWDECAKHVLEDMVPEFTSEVKEGDIIVAGNNLGIGHAHYYLGAVMGCRAAGVSALLADSFNMLFLRIAIDYGVPAWQFKGITDLVEDGDVIELNMATGEMKNLTTGKDTQFTPVSPIILDILEAGDSETWAFNRVKTAQ